MPRIDRLLDVTGLDVSRTKPETVPGETPFTELPVLVRCAVGSGIAYGLVIPRLVVGLDFLFHAFTSFRVGGGLPPPVGNSVEIVGNQMR